MSLTELQLPTKADFYSRLQTLASDMYRVMKTWEGQADFIGRVDTNDLDAMGVPVGQIRTDMVNLRTLIDEVVLLFEGNAVTPTNNPEDVIERIRRM